MNSIFLLTRLQLMQTIGGVRSAIEKKTGEQGAMAGTALIAAMVFAGLGWLGYEAGKLVGGRGFDTTVYDMLLLGCGVLTFAFSLPSILGSFFGSSDINDLLPLPVSPLSIALAKALSALTASYLWTLVFGVSRQVLASTTGSPTCWRSSSPR